MGQITKSLCTSMQQQQKLHKERDRLLIKREKIRPRKSKSHKKKYALTRQRKEAASVSSSSFLLQYIHFKNIWTKISFEWITKKKGKNGAGLKSAKRHFKK